MHSEWSSEFGFAQVFSFCEACHKGSLLYVQYGNDDNCNGNMDAAVNADAPLYYSQHLLTAWVFLNQIHEFGWLVLCAS